MPELVSLFSADIPLIMQIEAQCFTDDHWSEKQIQQQLLNVNAINLGIKVQGDLVGYALVGSVLDEAELYQIALLPECQGRGMATELLAQLCQQLAVAGMQRLLLEVRERNVAAIRLYESFGFTQDGRRKGYYASVAGVEDALLYSYRIRG
ncbi:ribosomal protein S18-alanine N-acetyltransferase [Neptunomonas qingdaonensis]|uniref:[Ribosomal protein bS18]-alanine N-acetyltransferase n=1 Tax=Neptunomonas qingdaonensis TaxID=1045558 RepID=A0A1I2NFU0_9GAMM|nr:ribosomal protein S18-alanine N-acetyltransferase [Neptunomonas qingdaonensis]SFG00191.1 ribosomal-protein-alanine N-acetyltransferase [Neptunomonas qingdaonensis]